MPIKAQIEETTSDCDKEKPQERLAKLAGGVAVDKPYGLMNRPTDNASTIAAKIVERIAPEKLDSLRP